MRVEYQTNLHALAASGSSINTPGGASDAQTPNVAPGDAERQDDAPKRRGRGPSKPKAGVLVLTCDRCNRGIAGSGSGFAYVSLVDASKTAQRAAAGYIEPAKARWTLAHSGCAPEALAPMSPHFRLWTDRIGTTDDLLDAMVTLSRQPWFPWTDWGSLVREVLADTETAAIKAERKPRKKNGLTDPNDPRHGTAGGYEWHGCRCDPCRTAANERRRAQRAKAQR